MTEKTKVNPDRKMSKLLLATHNQGKVREYQSLLKGIPFRLVTPTQQGITLEVEENDSSFEENARIKALAFSRASGLLALADDSGLEVDALHGEPGVRSHRYAGEGATDSEKVNYLLGRLKAVPFEKRTAHFRCVIALAWPDGRVEYCSAKCDGVISVAPRGHKGFGYDPIFYFPELEKTMAELPMEIKNKVSHRAKAAQEACQLLKKPESSGQL